MKDEALYQKLISRIRIDEATGCWLWTGPYWHRRKWAQNRYGYISIPHPRRPGRQLSLGTHRAMLWAIHGPLTPQQCACHRCDVPLCINPEHLFVGSMRDNIHDSRSKNRHHEGKKTHCDKGHPLSGDNLYVGKQAGKKIGIRRVCRTCQREVHKSPSYIAWRREYQRRRRSKLRASVSASPVTTEKS